ncbi:Receptor-type tyrosine-protein phosphatase V [Heterocephalus glaber]|uniref:protein-tyrosine-phosphatase n=1 Tax=Heterocephalus glaber TaxID=10181 RepID=G5B386_HETGA|nr:Receptor-type tyrosine-protein phosphatase V [Heterocephalus glaber]
MRPPILFAAVLWLQGFSTEQLQALTNDSTFEFQDLVLGSHYQLQVTALRPCGQNVTVTLMARTAPSIVHGLQLRSSGSPASLEASWGDAPGEKDSYQLLLYHQESQTLAHNISVSPDILSYNFGNLFPGTKYVLELTTWAGDLQEKTSIHQWTGTRYELTLYAAPGPQRVTGPNATKWTYPFAPLDLVLTPVPPGLWASWQAGPGAREAYVLKLRGPVEKSATLGPEACRATFPGPLAPGHYGLELEVLAGPYDACAQASAWLDDSAAQPRQSHGAKLELDGLEATREPGRRALLHADGDSGLLGNISMPSGTSHITFFGLVPGARYQVDIASSLGTITQSLMGRTRPLAPQSLEVTSRASLSELTMGWAPAPGEQEGCVVAWHQEGSQRGPGSRVDLGPDDSSVALRDLVPGSCYSVSVWAWAGNLSSSTRGTRACTSPLAPPLVNVTSEGPTQLQASWIHASGGQETYQVTLSQAGTWVAMGTVGAEVNSTSFPTLTPGTQYEVEVGLGAGPLRTPAANVSGWTLPCMPHEVLVSMQASSPVVSLAWASGPFGQAWHPPELAAAPQLEEPEMGLGVMITRGMFGKDDGLIQWYGVMATTNMSLARPSREALSHTWYDHYYGGHDSYLAVLLPNPFYPGPCMVPRSWTVPVGTEDCGHTQEICNASSNLAPSTAVPLPAVVGVMVGCALTVCAVLGLLGWWGSEGTEQGGEGQLFPPADASRPSELKEEGREQPRLEAEHPANITKNCYPHVLPCDYGAGRAWAEGQSLAWGRTPDTWLSPSADDHSRVGLAQLEGKPHSDYINANFIPVLCEHYWPAHSTPIILGRMAIHLLAEEPGDEWTKREFQLQHVCAQHKQRRVKQLQFTTWPDHSVPEAPGPLLAFVELVREQARATQGTGPILVHCSVGVGRTGTFVALLRLLQQLEEEQVVDVFNTVYTLQLHWPLMIQTPDWTHLCGELRTGACQEGGQCQCGFLKEYELLLQAIKNKAGSSTPPPGYEQDSTVSGGPLGHDQVVLTGPVGPEELWELVWEHRAHVLVSLSPPDTQEKGESGTERLVQRLQFPCQEPRHKLPATSLLPFLAAVGQCCFRGRSKKPGTLLSYLRYPIQLLVHCNRGAAQLGTFLAMEQLLQQAGAEQTVDVFKAALQQSQACALMTSTLEQYIYLYD